MAGETRATIQVIRDSKEGEPGPHTTIFESEVPAERCISVLTSGQIKLAWMSAHHVIEGAVYVTAMTGWRQDPDVEIEDKPETNTTMVWLKEKKPVPEKRCGNCKWAHEGVCENCAGDNFGSSTEIVSSSEGCENWEADNA